MARARAKFWFSKRTVKLRYAIVFFIIKCITPSLHKKIERENTRVMMVARVPRPSTKFMKKYFDNKSLVGVEVGVQVGNNAFSLMNTLNIRKLYLVDVYEGKNSKDHYKEAKKRMTEYANKIQFIIKKSVDASKDINEPIDFVYIDADHSYNAVYEDLEAWYPLIKEGGIMCGHDVLNIMSVLDAVKDWCVKKGIMYTIDFPDFYFVKSARSLEETTI